MEGKKFKIGDRVIVKATLPVMVVNGINPNTFECECVYFNSQTHSWVFTKFNQDTLEIK